MVVYYIFLGIMSVIALAIFYLVFRTYYREYKESPEEKRQRKLVQYLAVIALGLILIFVGQYYVSKSSYLRGLQNNWARAEKEAFGIEGPKIAPSSNITFEGFEIETQAEMEK